MGSDTIVWGTFDQETLDAEYNAAGTVPSLEPYFVRYERESARVRADYECRTDLHYGPGERETLDVFPAWRAGAPVLVYMHGGYWRRLSKDYFDFVAEPFVRAGAAVVVFNYALAPTVTLDEIVREMREAVAWVHAHAADANADANRIYASGHSAGGQLAGILAGTAWDERGLPADLVKGVVGISGLYDLEPVRLSNVNDWLHLDRAAAERNSPMRHLPDAITPLLAVVGSGETSEFRRQTIAFAEAWRANGSPADARVLEGLNHYDIVLDLLAERSAFREAMLSLMEL
jgi:arylformamidase